MISSNEHKSPSLKLNRTTKQRNIECPFFLSGNRVIFLLNNYQSLYCFAAVSRSLFQVRFAQLLPAVGSLSLCPSVPLHIYPLSLPPITQPLSSMKPAPPLSSEFVSFSPYKILCKCPAFPLLQPLDGKPASGMEPQQVSTGDYR